ncbi:hypothetical protein Q671_13935 [Halomonas sp. PBN3]|nr:hypothetical protein Q671_13935 [Halomonas sp. PBN3]
MENGPDYSAAGVAPSAGLAAQPGLSQIAWLLDSSGLIWR